MSLLAPWLIPWLLAITLLGSPVSVSASDGAPAPAPTYDWPLLPEPEVVREFAPPPKPWLAGHRGVDLAGLPGDVVLAAADGLVAFAGMVAGRGVVSIDHTDGVRTTYEPVTASVAAGESVGRGDRIGQLDAGHCPSGCLHWGARVGSDRYLDPLSLLRAVPLIRLLPDS